MHTVTVTGTGTSLVAPDSAVVRLAATGRGAGVAEAYDAMTAGAASVVEVAARHTDERRIASTGITVWPWHDQAGARQGFEAAFHDARHRAAALARMAGSRLGAVQTIVEADAGSGAPTPMPKLAMMRDSGGIEPGETSVTASVTVVWELVH